ncbi:MAG: hypothetical protein CMJ18_27195 [Phycisphaeraceae bacterium]|nr:hypothetical protein [Phycisphaeraceae bacterium]
MPDLRFIAVSGTPARMGESFGEQFREQIHGFFEARMNRLERVVKQYQPDRIFSRDAVLETARGAIDAHRRYDAPIWAEFEGIARGSGLDLDRLLVTNGLTDIQDLVVQQEQATGAASADVDECTALLVPPDADGGRALIAQTWDMHDDAREFLVVVRRKADDRPETMCLTTTGCLCLIGVNSERVAVGNTNLVPTDARVGVNYLFTITRALACRSAAEAADTVIATPRMSGHNFHIADGTRVINLECTATRVARTDVSRPFPHANHYLNADLAKHEYQRDAGNSTWRQDEMCRLVEDRDGPVSMEVCWDHLSRTAQQFVPAESRPDTAVATVATVVIAPASGRMDVCEGVAADDNRHQLKL